MNAVATNNAAGTPSEAFVLQPIAPSLAVWTQAAWHGGAA
jgi:hypothetical protein